MFTSRVIYLKKTSSIVCIYFYVSNVLRSLLAVKVILTNLFQGQPSFVRVYKYPNFGGPNAAVANRTFFKADKVEMMWNGNGTAMLLLTTTDTSESSYYGDQGLHFLGVNGMFWSSLDKDVMFGSYIVKSSQICFYCRYNRNTITNI